ncbi:NUDIX hydrolase [Filobacillus milosensis]|uniref:NUDIX hydrolase n=1 Tax=Filobacillus milosensis TaxID=94137 RepID=UPI001E2DF490|nr:NUDIX hydrolase [Filobacillus milosensis]
MGSPIWRIEKDESPEFACKREVKEETGYDVQVIEQIKIKETIIKGIEVKTYYFRVKKIGDSQGINDPDGIIGEADWKTAAEIKVLQHAYPDDKDFLLEQL